VFSPLVKGLGFAMSPAGRKVIRRAVRVARSEEGRKVVAQARKVAASPEGQKLIAGAKDVAVQAGKAARTPENRERVKAAARALRNSKR
jgi:hypothetical protein